MSKSKCCDGKVLMLCGENSSYYICQRCHKPCDVSRKINKESDEEE